MVNVMTRAWEIRKTAAKKFNCKAMEIDFAECLRMAWVEIKNADLFKFFEAAAKLCVTGKAGLQKLAGTTGKKDIVEIVKTLKARSKANTVREFGLWINLEIAKIK